MAGKAIFRIRTMVVLLSPALEGKQTHASQGMVSSMGPTAPSGFLVPRIGKVYQQGDNPKAGSSVFRTSSIERFTVEVLMQGWQPKWPVSATVRSRINCTLWSGRWPGPKW